MHLASSDLVTSCWVCKDSSWSKRIRGLARFAEGNHSDCIGFKSLFEGMWTLCSVGLIMGTCVLYLPSTASCSCLTCPERAEPVHVSWGDGRCVGWGQGEPNTLVRNLHATLCPPWPPCWSNILTKRSLLYCLTFSIIFSNFFEVFSLYRTYHASFD